MGRVLNGDRMIAVNSDVLMSSLSMRAKAVYCILCMFDDVDFEYLVAVCNEPDEVVRAALDELEGSGLVDVEERL